MRTSVGLCHNSCKNIHLDLFAMRVPSAKSNVPLFLLSRLWCHLNHIFNKWEQPTERQRSQVFGRRMFNECARISRESRACRDARGIRLRSMKRRVNESMAISWRERTNSVAVIFDRASLMNFIARRWARGEIPNTIGIHIPIYCILSPWRCPRRSLTSGNYPLSISRSPQLNLYDQPSYRPDIERVRSGSAPFSCLSR